MKMDGRVGSCPGSGVPHLPGPLRDLEWDGGPVLLSTQSLWSCRPDRLDGSLN